MVFACGFCCFGIGVTCTFNLNEKGNRKQTWDPHLLCMYVRLRHGIRLTHLQHVSCAADVQRRSAVRSQNGRTNQIPQEARECRQTRDGVATTGTMGQFLQFVPNPRFFNKIRRQSQKYAGLGAGTVGHDTMLRRRSFVVSHESCWPSRASLTLRVNAPLCAYMHNRQGIPAGIPSSKHLPPRLTQS